MSGRSLQWWSAAATAFAAWAVSCATNDVSAERFGASIPVAGGNGGNGGSSGAGGKSGSGGAGAVGNVDASADVAAPQLDAGEFSRAALLRSLGNCALETYKTARDRAGELAAALDDPAAELHGSRVATAWALAIDAWQQAELMQFGPAATPEKPGGQDLRYQIYSWPNVSYCSVDDQILKLGYEQPGFENSVANQRGLGALEYLIFHAPPTNSCSPSLPINRPDRWPALAVDAIEARRLAYARVAARDVRARAAALVDAWTANFLSTFTGAGPGNSVFPTDQIAFNAVTNAMFYLEKEVKDEKLARPLGKSELCTATFCPELLESRFANRSKQHIRSNLIGFEKLFTGCGPGFYGFADLLTASGAGQLATTMGNDVDAAIAAVDAIEEADLGAALAADRASVDALYEAIRQVTTALKIEFVTILDLELPDGTQGDND